MFENLKKNKNMITAVLIGAAIGITVGVFLPGSGIDEYLTELFIQTCCAGVGFAAGSVWMRDNYINYINEMQNQIEELKNRGGFP